MTADQMPREKVYVHALFVRVFHWVNALGMILMIMSGWRIYNASPLFDFRFPNGITLGGWLGGALQWHFAAMWLLVINLLVYVIVGFASGHFRRRFTPVSPSSVVGDMAKALKGKLPHSATTYNCRPESGLYRRAAGHRSRHCFRRRGVEAGAIAGNWNSDGRLRRRPPGAFLQHGGDLRLYCAAPNPGFARAQHTDTHDHRLGPQNQTRAGGKP